MSILGPAPRPCESCPYRQDVPSGVWSREEYEKLREYDEDTSMQPLAIFQCHQTDRENDHSRMCAGWVGCHSGDLLALRLYLTQGGDPAVFEYVSPVDLFASGNEAADHGVREIYSPSPEAIHMMEKISRVRNLVTDE